jgi:hypothetical protein
MGSVLKGMKKSLRIAIKLSIVVLSVSLIFATLTFTDVIAASQYPDLNLNNPEISGYSVTVNGATSPGTSGTVISKIGWNWGDGSAEDSWFPATHTYANSGTYTITVTSYQSDGLSTIQTTRATISSAGSSRPSMTPKSISMTPKSISSTSNIDSALRDAGLPADVQIIKVNVEDSISLSDPLIILGSGIDAMENQLFQSVTANYQVNSSYILNDKTSVFQGKGIENNDIVVIGGPDHNAYAKDLLSRGLLKYNVTNLKTSGLVIEAEMLPSGHRVIVVASVAGYPYSDKNSWNAETPVEPTNGEPTAIPEDNGLINWDTGSNLLVGAINSITYNLLQEALKNQVNHDQLTSDNQNPQWGNTQLINDCINAQDQFEQALYEKLKSPKSQQEFLEAQNELKLAGQINEALMKAVQQEGEAAKHAIEGSQSH